MVPRSSSVTPWQDNEEWREVQRLVLSLGSSTDKLRALDVMSVWRSRVARLPAGVETTSSLLQASLASNNSSLDSNLKPQLKLTLAAGLNRFLNHLSHIGMNLFGVSKYHEVADRLGVPDWLVEVRHETTHGQMPGMEVLEAGVSFGLTWLKTHYWERGRKEGVEGEGEGGKNEEVYGSVHKLLECYMYLKLYQVWGTERVADIKEQEEMYRHLVEMWNGFLSVRRGKQKGGILLGDLSFKEAVGIVKNELHKYMEDDEAVMLIAELLVKEELLIPSSEYLNSVQGEEEDVVGVPKELQLVWADLIRCVDDKVGLICLIDKLVEICGQSGRNLDLAVEWIGVLVSSYQGKNQENQVLVLNQRERGGVSVSRLEAWLENPNMVTLEFMGDLMDMVQPEMTGKMKKTVASLVKIAVGSEVGKEKVEAVYTEADLNGEDVVEKDNDVVMDWELEKKVRWEVVPLGSWKKQRWEDLWLPQGTVWEEEVVEVREKVPEFTVSPVDWTPRKREHAQRGQAGHSPGGLATGANTQEAVPAFYRNEENQNNAGHQRKRYRRS